MQTDNVNLAARLQGKSPEQSAQLKEQFVSRLRGELDGLLTFLLGKDELFEGTKRIDPASGEYHAVEILQFARYAEAADLFVRHLDTRSTAFSVVSDEFQSHFPFFPFAVAVSAIGTPAAVSALTTEILTADPTTTRFQLSCLVLKKVLGEELALMHVANSAKKDPQFREKQRQEQASRFLRMSSDVWEATFCSDFSAH